MKGRAHARGTAGGNSMAPGPGARPPRRPARPGRSLGGPSRTRSHPVSPAGGGPRAAGPFGFSGRRCPGRTGGLARRDFREPGAPPAVGWSRTPGDRRWWRRDSTATITAIGLTRATIAKRSPTRRCRMTTPTPTTGAGSGARRRLHLPSRKYPADRAPPTCGASRVPAVRTLPGGGQTAAGATAPTTRSDRDRATLRAGLRSGFPAHLWPPALVAVARRLPSGHRRVRAGARRRPSIRALGHAPRRNTLKKNLPLAVANGRARRYPCPNLGCTGFASADTGERSHDGHQDHHHVRLGHGSNRDSSWAGLSAPGQAPRRLDAGPRYLREELPRPQDRRRGQDPEKAGPQAGQHHQGHRHHHRSPARGEGGLLAPIRRGFTRGSPAPARHSSRRRRFLALWAEAEHVGLMARHREAPAARDPGCPRLDLARVDLFDASTPLAHQMVMVHRPAQPEQRLPALTPEDVDLPGVDQALERPVDGRQANRPVELRVEVLCRQRLRGPPQRAQDSRALAGAPCVIGSTLSNHPSQSTLPLSGARRRPRVRALPRNPADAMWHLPPGYDN